MASRQGKKALSKENREKVEKPKEKGKEGKDKEAKERSQEVNREKLKATDNEVETPKKYWIHLCQKSTGPLQRA